MQDPNDKQHIISLIGLSLARAGFKQEAISWLESNTDSIEVNWQVMIQRDLGNVKEAIKATEGTDPRYQAAALLRIARENKRPELYRKVIKLADSIEDLEDREQAYYRITKSIAGHTKRYGLAKKVANKISKSSIRHAWALGEIGSHSRSRSTLKLALDSAIANQSQWAIEIVAGYYADAGFFKKALKIADGLTNPHNKRKALNGMLLAMVKKGRIALAMETAGKILTEPKSRIEHPWEFAEALAQAGEYDKALSIAKRHKDYWGMLRIAETMAQAGHFHRAIALADSPLHDLWAEIFMGNVRVSKEEFQAEALAAVAAEMCKVPPK